MSRLTLRSIPMRAATGAYILHSGWKKWSGGEDQAKGVQGFTAGAYPMVANVEPKTFLKALSAAELALGTALVVPIVGNKLAGLLLTGFSAGLLGLYWRTPSMHEPGSIWPTQAGTAVSKDVWMLSIGLALMAD